MKKISVIIAHRHATSLSLEDEFYEQLGRLAHERHIGLNTLITQIDSERDAEENLSSAVRVYILKQLLEDLNASKTTLSSRPER
jgi:predicted DNA-binding ribbon-helix-helix protein